MINSGVVFLHFDCKHIEYWHKIVSVGNLTPEILMTAVNHPSKKSMSQTLAVKDREIKYKNNCGSTSVSLAAGYGFVCILNTVCDHSCNSVFMSVMPVTVAIFCWMTRRSFELLNAAL